MNDDRRGGPLLVGAVLLGTVALALFLTNLMRGSGAAPGASFPAEADGRPVIDVPAALFARNGDGREIAVSGWFQQSPPIPCPFPMPPVVELLNGNCTIDATWLMSEPEGIVDMAADRMSTGPPSFPAVNVVFDGPDTSWARPLPQTGRSVPTPVVFVGHFDDGRAAGCQPADLQRCLDRFVVTDVTWADGVDNP